MTVSWKKVSNGIVNHIIDNPCTHTELEERAQTKEWYTQDFFDTVMEKVARDDRISATVKDGEVHYKAKVKRVRKKAEPMVRYKPTEPTEEELRNMHKLLFDPDHPLFDDSCHCWMYEKPGVWEEAPVHRAPCREAEPHDRSNCKYCI